jgi:flagellar biogenesis protein FliO
MDLRAAFQNNPPNKILTMVLALAAVLLVLWLIVVAGSGGNNPPEVTMTPEEQERLESVRTLRDQAGQATENDDRADNMKSNVVTTFLVLMTLLAAVWWWSRRGVKTTIGGTGFKQIEHHHIGPGQSIQVLEINNEIWVLGVTSGNISLLHRYNHSDWENGPEITAINSSDGLTAQGKENVFYSLFKGNS